MASARATPQPINIQLHDADDWTQYHARPVAIRGNSAGESFGAVDNSMSSLSVSASPFSTMRARTPHGPSSQIRTCPIPERLRLQLRDASAHDSTDSSSPTVTAPSYLTRTPTDQHHTPIAAAPRVRRRGTISMGFSGVAAGGTREARQSPKDLDALAAPHPLLTAHSPHSAKTPAPLARRTSSSYSSWSAATPTSAFGTFDGSTTAAAAQTDHAGVLPEWETAGLSASAKRRTRSRRYSVFDLSFAHHRPAHWASSLQSQNLPPMLPSPGARRRSSNRSTAESVGSAELSGMQHARHSGASSVEPRALSISNPRHGSRATIRSPSTDVTSAHVYSRSASGYMPLQEAVSSRHHRRGQSQASVATFSSQLLAGTEPYRGSNANIMLSENENDYANDSGSGPSRRRHRRPFSSDLHDSSSGQSTPNHLLFARLRRKTSGIARSINGPPELCHSPDFLPRTPDRSELKDGYTQPWSAPRRKERARRGTRMFTLCQGEDDNEGYSADVEMDAGDGLSFLRFSTSTPDILVMPMVSHLDGRISSISRPDRSYERLLAMSRNTKVRRWRHRCLGLSVVHSAMDSPSATASKDTNAARYQAYDVTSPLSPFGVGRRATVSTAASPPGGVSRAASIQQPDSFQTTASVMRPRPNVNSRHAGSVDPAETVCWADWTAGIDSAQHAPAAERAIAMWRRISRGWSREHRSRQNSFRNRQDSSTSHLSTSNAPKASMIFSASSMQSNTGAMEISALPPSGGHVTAMLNPCLVEPTYLQRGVSESGRQVSPGSAFSSVYQVPSFGDLGSTQSLGIASADTVGMAGWSARVQDMNSAGEMKRGPPLPNARLNVAVTSSAFSDASVGLPAAPHRRLSVVKGQALGKAPSSAHITNASPPTLSMLDPHKHAGDSSSRISPVTPDKDPWVIAQLDDPDEAVSILQAFQSRLQLRLGKAKAESEQELVDIIQDLSEFVEEGLSYVNDDGASCSSFSEDSPASEGYSSEASYVSDIVEAEMPDTEVTPMLLEEEYRQALHAAHHHSKSTGMQPANVALDPVSGTVSAAARELKSLNKRLHDMLSLHGDDKKGEPVATRPMSQPSVPKPPQMPSPVQRLMRTPSIRRLTFFRALSGIRGLASEPTGIDSSSAGIAGSAGPDRDGSKPHYAEAETKRPGEQSSTVLASGFASDPELQIHGGTGRHLSPGIAVEPSAWPDEDAPQIGTCHSTPRIDQDLRTAWGGGQVSIRGKNASPLREIPFPSLLSKGSALSMASATWLEAGASEHSSISSGRCSPRERSQSRSSVYSAGSGTSLLVSPLIAEDEFKPTPFLQAIMDLVNIIGHVVSLSAGDMLQPLSGPLLNEALDHLTVSSGSKEASSDERRHAKTLMPTAYLVQRLNELGYLWEQPPATAEPYGSIPSQPWPCRGLFVRALLAISSLNRIVMWYVAVRATYCEEVIAELDRRVGNGERERSLSESVVQLLADCTRTVEINLDVHSPDQSRTATMEAKGMLIYNRARNEPSHVMWVLRYASDSPLQQVPALGIDVYSMSSRASEVAMPLHRLDSDLPADHVAHTTAMAGGELLDVIEEDEAQPSVLPVEFITCRICDRAVPATYFEEHTWLCAQSHRAAMDVEQQNDRLGDIKTELQAWYPGCEVEELEDIVHGGTDISTIREHAQQRASEIGNPAWQLLLDEASSVVKSMTSTCLTALALDESDAAPKCNLPGAASGLGESEGVTADVDFHRSDNWIKVANYAVPCLEYSDLALEALGKSLVHTITCKLAAIDNLQYAIVESSIACSNWVLPDEDAIAPDVFLNSECKQSSMPADDETSVVAEQVTTADMRLSGSAEGERGAIRGSIGLGLDKNSSHATPIDISSASRSLQTDLGTPVARKESVLSSSASLTSSLRITTSNLALSPSSNTPNRPSISGSAFLATPTVPSIHDFVLLKPISKGAYGSVFLAKKRATGEYYAIKILKKADMISKNQISNVKAERAIMMAQTGSPFVVRLLYTFQSRTNLYLVMEYLNGGDCAALLKAIGVLSEDWARNYLAEVVLGIEDLHARNVVHRDLKPDNLLIDSEGHLKLTDFGLSKLGFLGRRVDQHVLSHPLSAPDSAPRAGTPQYTGTASSRIWQPYLGSTAGSAPRELLEGSSRPTTPMQVAMVVPSISTPPPVRSDSYIGQRDDPSSYGQQSHLDTAPGNRIAALKGSSPPAPLAFGSGSSNSAVAGSSASLSSGASISTGSDACGNAPSPRQQKHALGTPDYIAPESILGLESGKSVDWWALGIICYEFLFGVPPFHDETPEKVFSNILSADIDFYDSQREQFKQATQAQEEIDDGANDENDASAPDISPEARDFITRLLCRDPKRRLGYNGAADVRAHPIFAGIDWDTLLETQPAFVPCVDDVEDTEYFDPRGATMDESDIRSTKSSSGDEDSCDEHLSSGPLAVTTGSAAGADQNNLGTSVQAGPAVSRSHPSELPCLNIGSGTVAYRPKTVPLKLGELSSQCSTNDGAESAMPGPQTAGRAIPRPTKKRSYTDGLPALADDPEFGAFTFKNLHALEQANMNELVKLRRRSTLLDVTSRLHARPEVRTALASDTTSESLPSPGLRGHRPAFFGNSGSSRNSVLLDMSPGPEASTLGSRRAMHLDPGEQVHGFATDRSPHGLRLPLSAGAPLARTRTLSCFVPSAGYPSHGIDEREGALGGSGRDESAARGRSISNSRDSLSIASPSSPAGYATPGHTRTLSAHALTHRGSLLNPSTQAPSSALRAAPRQPSAAAELPGSPKVGPAPPPEHMQSRVCLVADDNPVCLKIMEIVLRRMHLECVIVRNGAEAIRCAMGRTVFRAIFMDTGMPIVDGDEATRMIKSTYNANKDTPVIALAAYDGEAADSLYDDAIVKPVTFPQVKQCLDRCCC
ncbi:rim15, signal transduction response regulator [Coemansia sp. RSA 2322]|nr:rim15, signal transduction response regulator [Coemansia sp. RSA 2322]